MPSMDPPPPPIGDIPNTGEHSAIMASMKDHEKRLRANEKCSRDTLELARSTETAVGNIATDIKDQRGLVKWGVGLAVTVLISVLTFAGGFVMTTTTTTDHVVLLEGRADKTEADIDKLSDRVTMVRDSVNDLKHEAASDRRVNERSHMGVDMRLDTLETARMRRR